MTGTLLGEEALTVDPERFAYAYDTSGWYRIFDGLLPSGIEQVRAALEELGWQATDFPGTLRIDDLAGRSASLGELAEQLASVEWLQAAMTYPHRLIESYALDRRSEGSLPLHGGSSERLTRASLPMAEDISCTYLVRSGRMYSLRAKVLVYLDDVGGDDDGPLLYIEGSHKANFPFMQTFAEGTRAVRGYEHLLRPIAARAGTVLLLNEALVHGAAEKRSGPRRRVVVFTFAPSFAADWHELARDDRTLRRSGYVVPDTADSH